uniref:Uncharacterized protein n=1 Tax=Piliocolobus tephrosceles TaxID=591936 RepID=A0A8C9I298_9PRIM
MKVQVTSLLHTAFGFSSSLKSKHFHVLSIHSAGWAVLCCGPAVWIFRPATSEYTLPANLRMTNTIHI